MTDSTPWRPIIRLALAALTVFIGFGCLLPLFPVWAQGFARNSTDVGLATTLAAGVGLIAARPLAARLMEGRHRMPTMAAGVVVCTAATASFPWSANLLTVMGLRAIQGLGFGLMTTASISAITDLAPPAKRGQLMGYYGAMNALSFIIGPLLGAWIARVWSIDAAFYTAAAISGLALVLVAGVREPQKPPVCLERLGLHEVFEVPAMRRVVPGHFLAILLHGAILTFLPLRLAEHDGWMSAEAFFAIDAVVLIALRVGVGKRFDTLGRTPFVRTGLAALGTAGVLLGLGDHDLAFAAAAVAYGIGFGAYMPAVSALVGDVMPETHRARGFAVFLLAFDLALALGGVAVAPLADTAGLGAALFVAGLGPLLALALYMAPAPHTRTA